MPPSRFLRPRALPLLQHTPLDQGLDNILRQRRRDGQRHGGAHGEGHARKGQKARGEPGHLFCFFGLGGIGGGWVVYKGIQWCVSNLRRLSYSLSLVII